VASCVTGTEQGTKPGAADASIGGMTGTEAAALSIKEAAVAEFSEAELLNERAGHHKQTAQLEAL
jgi:hypothetical protein